MNGYEITFLDSKRLLVLNWSSHGDNMIVATTLQGDVLYIPVYQIKIIREKK